MNRLSTPRRLRVAREQRRAQFDARDALARELAAFDSRSDLIELSAMLERYDDADAEQIRSLIDWSPAA